MIAAFSAASLYRGHAQLVTECLSDGLAIPEIARTTALFRDQVAVACLLFAHHDAKQARWLYPVHALSQPWGVVRFCAALLDVPIARRLFAESTAGSLHRLSG